jgi:hypothetical protein
MAGPSLAAVASHHGVARGRGAIRAAISGQWKRKNPDRPNSRRLGDPEAANSKNNLPLVEKMLMVYDSPRVKVKKGYTV